MSINFVEIKKEDREKRRKRGLELLEKAVPTQKVVFDVETTGLDPGEDEILQFSAINGEGEVLLNTYVRPVFHECWPEAGRINGITPEMVANAPTFAEVWEDIQAIFLSASELISYNGAYFDVRFLAAEGIVFPDVPHYDVMLEFAPIYGEWNDYYGTYRWQKLTTCAGYYGYTFKAHDSLEDVRATLYCYNRMKEEEEANKN